MHGTVTGFQDLLEARCPRDTALEVNCRSFAFQACRLRKGIILEQFVEKIPPKLVRR